MRTANRDLVVYVLALLGGESGQVHTEDIAIKCFELFPDSFSWTKYPQYPDKDIVRVALTDARKSKYGALVTGRSGQTKGQSSVTKRSPTPDGWMLTETGIEWFRKNSKNFNSATGTQKVKDRRQQILRQLRRIREHSLFKKFQKGSSDFHPSIGELAELLRCRVDAEPNVWDQRLETIKKKAHATSQEELVRFIQACREIYLKEQ